MTSPTYIRDKDFTPNTMLALRTLVSDIGNETALYKEMKNIPNDRVATSATTCISSAKPSA